MNEPSRPQSITSTTSNRHPTRSEEHTSELQSPCNLVCRLLLEEKNAVVIVPTASTVATGAFAAAADLAPAKRALRSLVPRFTRALGEALYSLVAYERT